VLGFITFFFIIFTGRKNRRNGPRKCHKTELRFIVSLNADRIDELSDEEIFYESSSSHLAVFKNTVSTSTTESLLTQLQVKAPRDYKPTDHALIGAESDKEISDEEIIQESSTLSHFAVSKRPRLSSTPETCPQIPHDSPFHKPTNCVSANTDCEEELSDGEVIYDSPSCHVAVFKMSASKSTPESCTKTPQTTTHPFREPTSCLTVNNECAKEYSDGESHGALVNIEDEGFSDGEMVYASPGVSLNLDSDDEFSDGEIIYESPSCHVAVCKKTTPKE